MTEQPDAAPRSERLGVPLSPRERHALLSECEAHGYVPAIVARNLLREAGLLPDWSTMEDPSGDRAAAAARTGRGQRKPQAHLYAPLLGRYVELRRDATEAEQAGGTERLVGAGGVCSGVRDTARGVEILMHGGIAHLLDNDGAGWRLTISTHTPQEDR